MAAAYYLMKLLKARKKPDTDIFENYYDEVEPKIYKTPKNQCRVCLQDGLIPIYDEENTFDLSEIINILTDVNMTEDDEYPKYVCEMCFKFIRAAALFRYVAKKSDQILRQPIKEEYSTDYDVPRSPQNSDGSIDEPLHWSDSAAEDVPLKSEKKKRKEKLPTKVTCQICNKVVTRPYYKQHLTMHDPNHQKFVCDVCGKSFRLQCAYHAHSQIHKNDFPYKCQLCPYRSRVATQLKYHLRTHTKDYRYMCSECPAKFLFKSNFNRHMLRHKEPQFKCDTCKKAFYTKPEIRKHFEADHLGIKNHVCNQCGKSFGYRKGLMQHQINVHKREKLVSGRIPSYLRVEKDSGSL